MLHKYNNNLKSPWLKYMQIHYLKRLSNIWSSPPDWQTFVSIYFTFLLGSSYQSPILSHQWHQTYFLFLMGTLSFIELCFIALHKCCFFLQIEGKTLHQQKDYDSLYCHVGFMAGGEWGWVWNWTCNIFEVCLELSERVVLL